MTPFEASAGALVPGGEAVSVPNDAAADDLTFGQTLLRVPDPDGRTLPAQPHPYALGSLFGVPARPDGFGGPAGPVPDTFVRERDAPETVKAAEPTPTVASAGDLGTAAATAEPAAAPRSGKTKE